MSLSVSMCVYGGDNPEHFDIAIESIVNQTLKPNELVLTVDGPVPTEIDNIINKYKTILEKEKIDFNIVRFEENKGHGEARRVGIENCNCENIAIMDADDISVSGRFEKQISFLDTHSDVAVVGGNIEEFIGNDNDGRDISRIAGRRIVPVNDKDIKQYMKKRCPMNQVTVLFRAQEIKAVGGYIDWYCEEDYYLWLRLFLANKKFANINENLVYVRVGDEMYSRRGGFKYFKSEFKLQRFMYTNKLISKSRYIVNVSERFILQVMLPNKLRGLVFRTFARK